MILHPRIGNWSQITLLYLIEKSFHITHTKTKRSEFLNPPWALTIPSTTAKKSTHLFVCPTFQKSRKSIVTYSTLLVKKNFPLRQAPPNHNLSQIRRQPSLRLGSEGVNQVLTRKQAIVTMSFYIGKRSKYPTGSQQIINNMSWRQILNSILF